MTELENDLIKHFRTAAFGLPVTHVWRGYGSALLIELGTLRPTQRRDGSPGEPEGEIGLMIEWSWRIESQHSIICGSWSDEVLWRPTCESLVASTVIDLSIFGRLPEVMLSLSGERYVVSFMTAEGDPEWTLFDRRADKLLAAGCRSGVISQSRR